jgi:hypothetical protein
MEKFKMLCEHASWLLDCGSFASQLKDAEYHGSRRDEGQDTFSESVRVIGTVPLLLHDCWAVDCFDCVLNLNGQRVLLFIGRNG